MENRSFSCGQAYGRRSKPSYTEPTRRGRSLLGWSTRVSVWVVDPSIDNEEDGAIGASLPPIPSRPGFSSRVWEDCRGGPCKENKIISIMTLTV